MPRLMRQPTREYRTPVADCHRWDEFKPREGDIVIATYAKCGTTWTQRIVDLLVFQSPEVRPFGDISPWLDATFFHPLKDDLATLEAQTHRRYIKSHLPFDALPLWEGVKYIHVGRDGRDDNLSWPAQPGGRCPRCASGSRPRRWHMGPASGVAAGAPAASIPDGPRNIGASWLRPAGHGSRRAAQLTFFNVRSQLPWRRTQPTQPAVRALQ